jgi:hypothetical protein
MTPRVGHRQCHRVAARLEFPGGEQEAVRPDVLVSIATPVAIGPMQD